MQLYHPSSTSTMTLCNIDVEVQLGTSKIYHILHVKANHVARELRRMEWCSSANAFMKSMKLEVNAAPNHGHDINEYIQ